MADDGRYRAAWGGLRRFRAPTVVLLIALALRLAAFWLLESGRHALESAHHEHASIARSLARGEGFRFNFFGALERPCLTSIEAPLVPGLLALAYRVFGVETLAAGRALVLAQILVSALTAAGIWVLARQLTASKWGAWGAGLLAALYPPLIVSPLHIQALVWNLAWLVLLLLAAAWTRDGHARLGAIAFIVGGVGGLYTDPILAAVALPLLVFQRGASETLLSAGLRPVALALAVGVGIAPWLARNHAVHGRWVFVKDSFWFVLWQGNHSASVGTDKLPPAPEDAARLAAAVDPRAAQDAAISARRNAVGVNEILGPSFLAELRALPTEIERMDRFRDLALDATVGDPRGYLRQCARRLTYWIGFDPTNPRSYLWHYRAAYIALAALGLAGFSWRSVAMERWLPIWVALAGLTIVHVLVITSARFRIPAELLLVVPAGLTLGRCARSLWRAVERWGAIGPVPVETGPSRPILP